MRVVPGVTAVVTLVALASCGGSDGSGGSSSSTTATTATSSAAPPAELLGTYAVRLREGDLPASAPPELTNGGPEWVVTVRADGGVGGAPTFSIVSANEGFGELETSTPVVKGDELTLKGEECAAGGTTQLLDNVYSFALEGSQLTFTTVSNGCADRVAETILTSRPFTKRP